MNSQSRTLAALVRRLDREALAQLRQEAARLVDENEKLREQLAYAEDCAERWRENAISQLNDICERTGCAPGITVDGRLVVVA